MRDEEIEQVWVLVLTLDMMPASTSVHRTKEGALAVGVEFLNTWAPEPVKPEDVEKWGEARQEDDGRPGWLDDLQIYIDLHRCRVWE